MQSSINTSSQKGLLGSCLLSTAYFPPVEYFAALANSNRVIIEKCEMFQKQSYRTRCHIYGANGLLVLTIPVRRNISEEAVGVQNEAEGKLQAESHSRPSHKLLIDNIAIDYSKPWLQQHKRAIDAAYMNTPFFEYYRDDIFDVLSSGEESLFNLNLKLIELFKEFIGISAPIGFTAEWSATPDSVLDLRDAIHPKSKKEDMLDRLQIKKPYYQVFTNKQGFIPNLSVLDLLCNEGPNAISFLKAKSYR